MSPTASLFALSLATTLPCVLVTVTHAADGRALETSGWQPLEAGVAWRASLVEEPARDKREGEPVGNVGVPRNDNPRKLVIEVTAEGAGTVSRREEIVVPSETLSGDPCSVNRLEGLSTEGRVLVFAMVREFACGAGSSVSTTYRIEVDRERSRIVALTHASASRDAVWTADIEYLEGRMTVSDESPDADPDMPQKILKISNEPPLLAPQSLMSCLPPLRGPDVMRCGHP